MTEMQLIKEAQKRGLPQVGIPVRRADLEPNHLYTCFMDEYGNEYVIRREILTIVTEDGKVY